MREREALTDKYVYVRVTPPYYFKLHAVTNKVFGDKISHLHNSSVLDFIFNDCHVILCSIHPNL